MENICSIMMTWQPSCNNGCKYPVLISSARDSDISYINGTNVRVAQMTVHGNRLVCLFFRVVLNKCNTPWDDNEQLIVLTRHLLAELLNAVYSNSRQGVITAWLSLEWPDTITPLSKTFTLQEYSETSIHPSHMCHFSTVIIHFF